MLVLVGTGSLGRVVLVETTGDPQLMTRDGEDPYEIGDVADES